MSFLEKPLGFVRFSVICMTIIGFIFGIIILNPQVIIVSLFVLTSMILIYYCFLDESEIISVE